MQIRPLGEDERQRFGEMQRDAFVVSPSNIESWLPFVKLEDTRGLYNDQGELITVLRLIWNELWLGAHRVKMAGITSVATPPENRRGGHLKTLLRQVMADERERGTNISALYPFEFPFYKKFGYELASATQTIKVSLSAIAGFKSRTEGRWVQRSATDWELFRSLYDQYCVGRFGRIERREERWWKRQLFLNWFGGNDTPLTAYTWQDNNGQVRAYILYWFKALDKGWDRELRVREMVWLDEAARHEIYSFIANHDSQASRAVWNTEPGDEFFALLSDPREAEISFEPGYMLRLLDVERALLERPWPLETNASFSIAVRDDILSWNNDRTYHLELRQGRPEVTATAGSEQAGLRCDVRTLAQLYAGYLSPMQAARLGLLTVARPADLDAAQLSFSPPGQPSSMMADFW